MSAPASFLRCTAAPLCLSQFSRRTSRCQTPCTHTHTHTHTHPPRHGQLYSRPTTMAARDTSFLLIGLLVLFHTWGGECSRTCLIRDTCHSGGWTEVGGKNVGVLNYLYTMGMVRDPGRGKPLVLQRRIMEEQWGYYAASWANVEVNMEDRVEVYRGEMAQIACMFISSDGVGGNVIQWFYVKRTGEKQRIYYQDSANKVVDKGTPFTDRISVNGTGAVGEIVLTVSNVQLDDELEFIFVIKALTDGTGEGRTKLKVFETPGSPTIEGVQTGISVHEENPSKIGTCEVKNGYPKPNITWYRNKTPIRAAQDVVKVVPSITTESSGLYSVKSELSMKVMKEDKDDLFYCEVTYFVPGGLRMTETSPINITVFYPSTAVSLWVESPKGKIKEGDSIELHCHVDGNKLSSIISISHEDGSSWENKTVVLENVSRLNSGVYTCTSTDTDTWDVVLGNTTVFVNCKEPAQI
ncbi:hypothetical protein F7725_020785 [Dissostichus mawsoni]|uniref:Ig-like domain-containing protein n=1 Tax=Dissostichus mawsoni TaxID=36200 RepID=A0A7J5YGX8_DISMA|nr:hypothetical protein F7725_020785 [Dissostichus mawsoni]